MLLAELLFAEVTRHATLSGLTAQHLPVGVDECTDELIPVSDDSDLLEEGIDREQALEHLRSDVLTVGSLEEVLDTLREVEHAILHPTSIPRAEEAVFGERLSVGLGIIVVARRHRRALDEDLTRLGIDLHLEGGHDRTD